MLDCSSALASGCCQLSGALYQLVWCIGSTAARHCSITGSQLLASAALSAGVWCWQWHCQDLVLMSSSVDVLSSMYLLEAEA
jgi:hypothetical protein